MSRSPNNGTAAPWQQTPAFDNEGAVGALMKEAEPANESLPAGSFVRSLKRGLDVLASFGTDAPSMTIAVAARRSGLTRAAARRSLFTLADLGYLTFNDGQFAMTPKVLDLAQAYLESTNLDRVSRPHIEELVHNTRESSSLAVLDFPDVVYVVHVPAYRIESFVPVIGSRMPAFVNSMGRVLLANVPSDTRGAMLRTLELRAFTAKTITDHTSLETELAVVRAQGWALVDQEFSEGVRSIAAPVFDRNHNVVGAVNITTNAVLVSTTEILDVYLPPLLAATAAIGAEYQGLA